MNVSKSRAPRVILATLAQGRALLRDIWAFARPRWWTLPLVTGLSILILLLLFPHDRALLVHLHALDRGHRGLAHRLAWFFSTFGDYPTYNLPLALGLWLYGVLARKSTWRRLAVICLLGATFAGVFDDCLRLTLGRPRPDAHLADGFYGLPLSLRGGYQSFPSGHAASVFGASIALLFVDWRLGAATTLFSLCVVWARMELYRHYPSDVLVGSLLGCWIGWLVGRGARLRPERHSRFL